MEKQKQIDGRHRSCTEANCTPNTQVCPANSKSLCHFGLGHPYLHDPMWFPSPAHYMLNTLCSTRQEVFQELLIQLLLPDPSNNGGRKKSSFVGQAHSFQSVLTLPNMLLLLSDVTKVLNFQGSVSGKLQSAFSTCARRPPFPVQILQSQRHLPTCTCCARLGCLLLIPPGKPLEPSSPLQPWASHVQHQSSPIPQVHFLYGIRHKITMLNVFRAVQSLEDAMAEA